MVCTVYLLDCDWSVLTCPCRQRADQVVAAAAPPAHRQIQAPADGIFLLVVHVSSVDQFQEPRPLNVSVHIEMKVDYGYLSAADWPNLPVCDGFDISCRHVTSPTYPVGMLCQIGNV